MLPPPHTRLIIPPPSRPREAALRAGLDCGGGLPCWGGGLSGCGVAGWLPVGGALCCLWFLAFLCWFPLVCSRPGSRCSPGGPRPPGVSAASAVRAAVSAFAGLVRVGPAAASAVPASAPGRPPAVPAPSVSPVARRPKAAPQTQNTKSQAICTPIGRFDLSTFLSPRPTPHPHQHQETARRPNFTPNPLTLRLMEGRPAPFAHSDVVSGRFLPLKLPHLPPGLPVR